LCIWILLLYRRVRYGYAFRKIALTQGKFAIVDAEDYEELAKYKWFAVSYERICYALRAIKAKESRGKPPMGKLRGKERTVRMHRAILDVPKGKIVDHINHNGLDNRRSNLRVATRRQNSWNKRKRSTSCSSQYKGVTWFKKGGKWQAKIVCKGRWIFLGYFDDENAAARAYDAKAAELFGEYAALNFGGIC